MQNVRIWYSKTGPMRYVSHLDLTRCMARAIKRSGLPVWYTQGFNPRIYMNFAMPLSLGASGEKECLDIRLDGEAGEDLRRPFQRLAECLPQGLTVLGYAQPELGFEEIAFAEYEIWVESEEPDVLAEKIRFMLDQEKVIVMKHSKKGDKAIDIKPFFKDMEMVSGVGGLSLRAKLPCTLNGSVNPGLLMEALKSLHGIEPYTQITRKRLLTKDLSDMQ